MGFNVNNGVTFKNEKGITFHSSDLGLLFSDKELTPSKRKTYTVQTPFSNGTKDLTREMYGDDVYYEDGKTDISFIFTGAYDNWEEMYTKVQQMICNQNIEFMFYGDIWVRKGYFTMNSFKTNRTLGIVSVTARTEPIVRTNGVITRKIKRIYVDSSGYPFYFFNVGIYPKNVEIDASGITGNIYVSTQKIRGGYIANIDAGGGFKKSANAFTNGYISLDKQYKNTNYITIRSEMECVF